MKATVNCGDWGQSWGLSTKTLGKLGLRDDNETYVWLGWSQGRHGQKSNANAKLVFKLGDDDEIVVLESKGIYPNRKALREGLRDLSSEVIHQEELAIKRAKRAANKAAKEAALELKKSQTKLDI